MLVEGPRTFKDLCAFRGVAPPTLSRSIDAMVKRGWIERVPHPDDKRKLLLQATEEGQRHFKELVADSRDHLALALHALNSEERDTIAQALDLLKRVLDTP
jgi:DNA-binding MarR family transcriptional regulator